MKVESKREEVRITDPCAGSGVPGALCLWLAETLESEAERLS